MSLQVCGANVRFRSEEGECTCGWPLYVGDSCRWLVENGEDVAGPFCSTICAEAEAEARSGGVA